MPVKIQETIKYRASSEKVAIAFIEEERQRAHTDGFEIKKSSYVRKTKKSKGEIIAEWWIVEITYKYAEEYDPEEC